MRCQTFLFLCVGPLLIACANRGTIVQKTGRPLPFAFSLGIDASYKFALRDRPGHIRWQLVSGEVFNSYRVGDYFNDESPTPPRRRGYSKDQKETPPICPHETIPIQVPRFQPIPLEPRLVRRVGSASAAEGNLGSARVSRVGDDVSSWRTLRKIVSARPETSTRDARATQTREMGD